MAALLANQTRLSKYVSIADHPLRLVEESEKALELEE
jgi:hypothetical protein